MPSLMERVTRFGRSPKGQSMIRDAVSRFTGGSDSRKSGRKSSRSASRRGAGGRRSTGGRTRSARKR